MNNRGAGAPLGADQSALSLLVNAADSHNPPRDNLGAPAPGGRTLADTLRLRGLAGDGGAAALEEQLLLQQQSALQQQNQLYGNSGLLSQIRDQNLLSQLGQQQQLASLLGLGAPAPAPGGSDMRSALAAQLRQQAQAQAQQPQFTQADLLALSRSGGLSGLAGLGALGGAGGFSGAGGAGAASLASELEGLQRLEELERQQRLLSASSGAPLAPSAMPRLDASQLPSLAAMEQARQAPPPAAAAGAPADPMEISSNSPAAQLKAEKASEAAVSGTVPDVVPKDEVEKAPGSVIVPCRARGMPMDHNFKTAYFVIPENVKHGEELICSYFACRNAGIKFRYCSHCKVPVAKRNFRKRHKHGREIVAGEDSCGEDEDPSYKKDIPSQIMAGREEDGLSSQTGDSTNQNDNKAVEKGLVRNSMRTFEDSKHSQAEGAAAAGAAGKTGGEKISSSRKQRWARLLAKRPSTNDGDSMSNWLMEVLAVSDLETPLKSAEDGADGAAAAAPPAPAAPSAAVVAAAVGSAAAPKEGSAEGDVAVVKKKKKRAADIISQNGESEKGDSSPYAGGSFAEWKERKKQRKQSKSEDNSAPEQE